MSQVYFLGETNLSFAEAVTNVAWSNLEDEEIDLSLNFLHTVTWVNNPAPTTPVAALKKVLEVAQEIGISESKFYPDYGVPPSSAALKSAGDFRIVDIEYFKGFYKMMGYSSNGFVAVIPADNVVVREVVGVEEQVLTPTSKSFSTYQAIAVIGLDLPREEFIYYKDRKLFRVAVEHLLDPNFCLMNVTFKVST